MTDIHDDHSPRNIIVLHGPRLAMIPESAILNKALRDIDVRVMAILSLSDGSTIHGLATELGITIASVKKSLKRLTEQGFVYGDRQ